MTVRIKPLFCPFTSPIRGGLRLVVVWCLIVLICGPAATGGGHASVAPPQAMVSQGPSLLRPFAVAVFETPVLSALAGASVGKARTVFGSVAETEPPDVELVLCKTKTVGSYPIPQFVPRLKASSITEGAHVPLYLTHRSLLC